ncbi:MAG: dTMP kinase [Micromonosporaceae bacterium]|nr:dTMP kinase [Micromonosporaceae bacterium]
MAADPAIPRPRSDASVQVDGPSESGLLLAIEGIDHSGKTTLTRTLAARLRARWRVETLVEPSRGPIGALFRHLSATEPAPPMAMALLSAADRHAQQPHLLRHLATHDLVLADRYYLSGLAYHAADGIEPTVYQRLCERVRRPDAYLFLDLDPEQAAGRVDRPADGYWELSALAARLPGSYRRCLDLVVASEQAAVFRLDAARPAQAVADAAIAAVTRLLTNPSLEGLSA